MCKYEVRLQREQFLRRLFSHLRVIERAPASVDSDVAAFDPSELLKSLSESVQIILKFRIGFPMHHQHTDAPYPFGMLRACRERPNRH